MGDKGGCPRGRGKSPPALFTQLERRIEGPSGCARTRERWVLAPWKCLVQELFIRRLSTKIFALKWPRFRSSSFNRLIRKLLTLLSSPSIVSCRISGWTRPTCVFYLGEFKNLIVSHSLYVCVHKNIIYINI